MNGVCFDMDGVLIHSEEFWVERQREHILPTAALDDEIPMSAITGRNYAELYPELESEYDLAVTREEFEALFEAAGEEIYAEHATLLPGAHDLLSTLRERGVALALTTSSPVDWIALVDDRFDLLSYFDAVVSAETLDGPGKPAPDIYERGVAELGLSPDVCVAVEDSTAGARAASRAGLWTIGFHGDGGASDLSVADEVVEGSDALRAALLRE
ncbi:HAD family hydrolase [Natronorarus salvus]|uniref:HAD family hydrolase n=1 Tax=Natronorarus salvus TaxID=3117733 RepID=UPI002F266495